GLVSVLAVMAEWGMTMLGEPRAHDEVRGEWIVLGLAVTALAPDVADGATYELHIDGEVLHVQVRDGNLQPHQGPADDPDAVLTMDATALADVSAGRLDVGDAHAGAGAPPAPRGGRRPHRRVRTRARRRRRDGPHRPRVLARRDRPRRVRLRSQRLHG